MKYKKDDNRYRVRFMRTTEQLMDAMTVKQFISYLEENAEFEDNDTMYLDGRVVDTKVYCLHETTRLFKEFAVTEDGRLFYLLSLIQKAELIDNEPKIIEDTQQRTTLGQKHTSKNNADAGGIQIPRQKGQDDTNNTYNTVQAAYMLHKANVEALETQADKMELAYITAHNITNEDGSKVTKSWHINDDVTFDIMLNAIGADIDALGMYEAKEALRQAEDDLIRYGLSLMPATYSTERQTLENVCFGLNGHPVRLYIREKFIETSLKLDVSTIPMLADARILYGLR